MDSSTLIPILKQCCTLAAEGSNSSRAFRLELSGVSIVFVPSHDKEQDASTAVKLCFTQMPSAAAAMMSLEAVFGDKQNDIVRATHSRRLPQRHVEVYKIELQLK